MVQLQPTDFPDFFQAIYGYKPFPWQRMLVERVAEDGWPEGIDLPTASGKTACIDVAVFLLALGEEDGRLRADHPARRRIFFVVDRRIVVDEAYERAKRLAQKLANSQDDIVKQVTGRLRKLVGTESPEPLVVSRLRGGTIKDERWRLSPAQPAIITSTVDQIGSRLLFRSYGASNLSATIDAGLTACDSLVLLDEAHCAVPFMQTARAVQRYAGEGWIDDEAIVSPLMFSILSATLPADVTDIFPKPVERDAGLVAPELQKRITASKPAELVQVNPKREHEDALVHEAARRVKKCVDNGRMRIAVMVNRVATAARIAAELCVEQDVDVVLMTGRMRPLDRDDLVRRWSPWLKSGSKREPERPIIAVTTQCLEVGADFSFDALITECASLDALRQRFGRLNRLGDFDGVDAAVLIRKADIRPNDKLDEGKLLDPIYGNTMARTWNWLCSHADNSNHFGFGIDEVNKSLRASEQRSEFSVSRLNAPSPDSPVMLPAHVDLLCQTAPVPVPDPDVAIFLHGPQRGVPEAFVVFRADLSETDQKSWSETISLLPPLPAEVLTVPLWLLRKWLTRQEKPDDVAELSDVEGQETREAEGDASGGRAFTIWRGRRECKLSNNPEDVRPNDTIVVPADEELAARLGHAFCRPANTPLDIAELAYRYGRNQYILRLTPGVYRQGGLRAGLLDIEPFKALLQWANDDDRERGELHDLLSALQEYADHPDADTAAFPACLREAVRVFSMTRRPRLLPHPAGGVVIVAPADNGHQIPFDLDFADMDDGLSPSDQSWSLSKHTDHLLTRARAWAERCLSPQVAKSITLAAELHDVGKADPRFQIILHGDELKAAVAMENGCFLAKSDGLFRPPSVQRRLRAVARLPDGFRHEMLSMQLAELAEARLPNQEALRELVLHLVASHHGYARPFAPVCLEDDPPGVTLPPGVRIDARFTAERRRRCIPPHRLDSGVAERFWNLTRRYGWWGLAYLECILRLADWNVSVAEASPSRTQEAEVSR